MSKAIDFGAKSSPKDKIEEGVYEARIARIIHSGLRSPNPKFATNADGSPKPPKDQLRFEFELNGVPVSADDDRPQMISLPFVNITGGGKIQSKLEGVMKAAGVKAGESFEDMIGKVVSVTLVENGDYVNVSAVGGVSAGVKASVPPLVAKGFFFDFDNPDQEILLGFPDFIKDDLKKAVNFSGSKVEEILNAVPSDTTEEVEGSL